jgi:hypothetical protein
LDGACLEVKRLLNNSPIYKNKKNFLVPLLTEVQQEMSGQVGYTTGKYFSSEDQKEFMKKFQQGNEKVAREFLGREDGVLFRDEMIAAEDDKATKYSAKELVLLLGDVIAKQQEIIEEKDAQIAEIEKPVTGLASVIKRAFH